MAWFTVALAVGVPLWSVITVGCGAAGDLNLWRGGIKRAVLK